MTQQDLDDTVSRLLAEHPPEVVAVAFGRAYAKLAIDMAAACEPRYAAELEGIACEFTAMVEEFRRDAVEHSA